MKLPQSFFYKQFKEETLVLIDGLIWNVRENKKDENYLKWYAKTFGLEKGNSLTALEEDYTEKNQDLIKKIRDENTGSDDIRLVDFVLNCVIAKKREEKSDSSTKISGSINKKNAFICEGMLFDISREKKDAHEIRIEQKSYSIGKSFTDIENFELKYKKTLEETLLGKNWKTKDASEAARLLKKGWFYNKSANIGFERTEKGFFAYTIILPYALYERENNKHYRFGEAKIGLQLDVAGNNIIWHEAVVINEYMHPALPSKGTHQKICTGKFSYETIRQKYDNIGDQVRIALQKARSIIESGYFSSHGSWNTLTDPKYNSMELKELSGWRVTNI